VTTARLVGRRISRDDLPYLIEIDSDPRVQQTLFGRVQTEEQSRGRLERWLKMWEDHGFGFWRFADGQNNTIGHAGVFPSAREEGEVEVGYALKPAHWGRGFATEMTLESLRVGFEQLGLRRIIAIAQASNLASRRVMEKCGMTFECETPSPDGITGVRYTIAAPAPLT
jgi:ribosomal-protein-alanine N-acetyltransferase